MTPSYPTTLVKREPPSKQRVFDHYDNCCAAPGCDVCDPEQLCLDHVDNDGSHDRQAMRRRGQRLYEWILKQVEADGPIAWTRYQLLCFNHNRVKEAARQARAKHTQDDALPPNDAKVQIRLTVLADTDAYLAQMSSANHPKGEVVDDLYKAFKDQTLLIREMHAWLKSIHEVTTMPSAEPRVSTFQTPPEIQAWLESAEPSRPVRLYPRALRRWWHRGLLWCIGR